MVDKQRVNSSEMGSIQSPSFATGWAKSTCVVSWSNLTLDMIQLILIEQSIRPNLLPANQEMYHSISPRWFPRYRVNRLLQVYQGLQRHYEQQHQRHYLPLNPKNSNTKNAQILYPSPKSSPVISNASKPRHNTT